MPASYFVLQGRRLWGGMDDVRIAAMDLWGAKENTWWLLKCGKVFGAAGSGLGDRDHVQVRFRSLGGAGEEPAREGRPKRQSGEGERRSTLE